MLRLFVLLLLAVNVIFLAWTNGYLSQWGWAASSQRESFRFGEQIEPDRIAIRPADKAPPPVQTPTITTTSATVAQPTEQIVASTPDTAAATICLTAGAFNDKQSSSIKQALDAKLPSVRWRFDVIDVPARWIVYMGKYPNIAARDLKKSQLEQIKVSYEVLTEGNLEPGLSLGSHASQAAANQALQVLVKRGVRTARVLQELPEQKGQNLVVPALDEVNRAKLNSVYASLSAQLAGKTLQACKN